MNTFRKNRPRRKIGFLGGSFDPIHNGHLAIAECALNGLQLDRVYFVPALQNPLKDSTPSGESLHRLRMLELATDPHNGFGIWDGELAMEGPSYTLRTVKLLEQVYPNAHLFWIIGSDQLKKLHLWRAIDELVYRISFILIERPGEAIVWPGIPGLKIFPVTSPNSPLNSTAIRESLSNGHTDVEGIPKSVQHYIHTQELYKR